MKQRFLSIFTVVALMASVIAGAMGVSLRPVKAAAGQDIYSDDLRAYFLDLVPSQSSDINAFFDKVDDALEPGSNQCVFAGEKNGYWIINIYNLPSGTNVYSYADQYGNSGISKSTGWANVNFLREAYFSYNGTITYAPTSDQFYALMGEGFNYSNPAYWSYYFVPNIFDYQSANVYSSVDILPNGGFSFSANFFGGSPEPEIIYFDLGVFWLGNRQYLSILQQDIMRDLDPEHLNDAELIVYLYNGGEGDYKTFSYSDVTLIPGDWQFFVNLEFTNVSPMGLYVIDITDNDWDIITRAEITHFDEDYVVYAISDSHIDMNQGVPGTDGTPDTYTQAFNYFSEYVNNYNQTHVIPENLAETLFGANGSKLYPVTISEPTNIANTASGSDVVTTQGLHTFKWSMVEPDHLGYNYDLFDTVIVPSSLLGYYGLVYFYDDTLQKPFQFIDVVSFGTLLEEFDCIIIVPDDRNTLEENIWWSNLLPAGLSGFDDMAVSGSSSLGIEYVDDAAIGNNYQGFVIVTKRAIQKQQLYVFNDGITKTYKLMSDYIEKRGNWEDSFLTWTASLFSQWQTLDGKLGNIYNLLYGWNLSSVLSDISESLARIANNTSEEDPGYWFLSLFNWLNRFSVTDSDFANWVSEYDNFTDDLPDPGSGATVIPFPTAIPTVAVGG